MADTTVQVVYHVHEEHFRKLSTLKEKGFLIIDRSEAMFLKTIAPTIWPGIMMQIDGTFSNDEEPYVELNLIKEFEVQMRIEDKTIRGSNGYYGEKITVKQVAKDYETAKLLAKERVTNDRQYYFAGFIG